LFLVRDGAGCRFSGFWVFWVRSVTAEAAWQLDVSKRCKVEIDDGFECVGGGAVAQAVGECGEPVGIFGL